MSNPFRLLIGGSPCKYWSIAQGKNRETTPDGEGGQLFLNYVIAMGKFRPHHFIYENNKSIAKPIKDFIHEACSSAFGEATTQEVYNSADVAAQQRWRIYEHDGVAIPKPDDRGILLKDILESGVVHKDKSYCLDASYYKAKSMSPADIQNCLSKSKRMFVAEPVRIGTIEHTGAYTHDSQQYRVYSPHAKSVTLKSNGGGVGANTGLYAVPLCVAQRGRYNEDGSTSQRYEVRADQKTNTLTTVEKNNLIIEPAIINAPHGYNNGSIKYDKSPTLTSAAWQENNLVIEQLEEEKYYFDIMVKNKHKGKVYKIENSKITIKGKQYDILLPDGFYIIRKLTVVECCRLQTMPDDYFLYPDGTKIVSDTQAYKGLGNGWTAEIIIHILSHLLKDVPKDYPLEVLSMYDGIGTGRYCLDKMGYTNIKYYAYEIDKYAMKVASANYPDIIQCGDAFDIRRRDWSPELNNNPYYQHQTISKKETIQKQLTIEDFIGA